MKKFRIFLYFLLLCFWGSERYAKPPARALTYQMWFREVLSDFPELRQRKVELVWTSSSSTLMATRPDFWSSLSRSENRTYNILFAVNYKFEKFLETLAEEELKSWFAHELGHAVHYDLYYKGKLSMIYYGLAYSFSDKFMKKSEEFADVQAIEHGHGCGLIDGVRKMLDSPHVGHDDKKYFHTFYLSILHLESLQSNYENNKRQK